MRNTNDYNSERNEKFQTFIDANYDTLVIEFLDEYRHYNDAFEDWFYTTQTASLNILDDDLPDYFANHSPQFFKDFLKVSALTAKDFDDFLQRQYELDCDRTSYE